MLIRVFRFYLSITPVKVLCNGLLVLSKTTQYLGFGNKTNDSDINVIEFITIWAFPEGLNLYVNESSNKVGPQVFVCATKVKVLER